MLCIRDIELKQLLAYDPETGVFTWKKAPGGRKDLIGKRAGCKGKRGYMRIKISQQLYYVHRLAWLYMTGSFPEEGYEIDHINRDKTDNRWTNLRLVEPHENCANRGHDYPGVGLMTRVDLKKRWYSRGPRRHGTPFLGYYLTHLAACYARHAYDTEVH